MTAGVMLETLKGIDKMSALPIPPIQSPPFTGILLQDNVGPATIAVLYQSSGDTSLWMVQSSDGVNWAPLNQFPSGVQTRTAVAAVSAPFSDTPLWVV